MIDSYELPGLEQHPQINPQDPYFNSGVLLIDTERWRSLDIRKRCIEYLTQTAGNRRFPDQDALNVACYGQWLRLNKRWNHMMASRLDTSRGSELQEAVIVHSAGPVKHWHEAFIQGARTQLYKSIQQEVHGSALNARRGTQSLSAGSGRGSTSE
jgi:lipopolysaccharide biosynthesis glycosyltransferase